MFENLCEIKVVDPEKTSKVRHHDIDTDPQLISATAMRGLVCTCMEFSLPPPQRTGQPRS